MAKHTPKPWRIGKDGGSIVSDWPDPHADADASRGKPEHVDFYGGHLIAESIEPRNRPLISAAPDLLEACKDALNSWERNWMLSDTVVRQIRAAIAKGEGKQ